VTPLALLHPSGVVRRALVVGEAAARYIGSGLPAADGDAPADVIVADESVVPSVVRERLAHDGFAYVVSSRTGQRRIADSTGLEVAFRVVHVGERAQPRYLVPAKPATVRWALCHLSQSRRAAWARVVPSLAGRATSAVALRHRDAPPLGAWLDVDAGDVIVGRSAALVLQRGDLSLVVKPNGAEREALRSLAPTARAAGADVPEIVRDEPVLVQTGLRGMPAAVALSHSSSRHPQLEREVSAWLVRWNTATAVERPLSGDVLRRELLDPARSAGVTDTYATWIEQRCRELEGTQTKLVAAHNDLTTANVLVGGNAPIGVVDWEVAEKQALPFKDLHYALADIRAARGAFRDTLGAFRASLADDTHEDALRAALHVEPAVVDLCFHACWLRHAANEASSGSSERRFRAIVATIARERLRMDG